VGAGDHQDRDRPLDRLVGLAEQQPDGEGDDADAGGEVEEQRRRPVGQGLGPRAGRLGLGDQPADPGQGGLLADGVHLDPDRRVGDHGAGDHPVAGPLGDRAGLAGDHGLVHLGLAVGDHTVGRHPAAGADEDEVADGQAANGHGPGPFGGDQVGLVGQQRRQGV
jgi:hypothetical protein